MTQAEEERLKERLAMSNWRCDVCNERQAETVFDATFVCPQCQRVLERALIAEGKQR